MTEPLSGDRWRLPRGLRLLLQLLLTVGVTWFILKAVGVSLDEVRGLKLSWTDMGWGWAFLSTVLLLLAYLFSAALWGLMVRELGGPRVDLLPALRVFFTANLGRYLPGKLWQIAGMALLAQKEGVRVSTATAAALLGQAFSLAGATLVGLGVLVEGGRGPLPGGGWTVGLGVALLVMATYPRILWVLVGLWFRLAREKQPGGFRPDDAFGVRWMGLHGVGWVLQGGAFLLLVRAMGMDLPVMAGIPAYAAAYLLGYVAVFAPAGLGVREGVLIVLLDPWLGPRGVAVAVVARLWSTLVELLPAAALAVGYVGSRGKGDAGRA